MTSVRAAKSKGSQFEYDCQYSLSKIYPDIYRTSERGFQRQYDLASEKFFVAFECKRLKSLSWNQAKKYYEKLKEKAPNCNCYLLFKSNQQPCLVMTEDTNKLIIQTFEDYFNVPFLKHPSTRAKK
jgi:hypothetical protein